MRFFVYFNMNNTCFDIQLLLLFFMCVCLCGEMGTCTPQHTWVKKDKIRRVCDSISERIIVDQQDGSVSKRTQEQATL